MLELQSYCRVGTRVLNLLCEILYDWVRIILIVMLVLPLVAPVFCVTVAHAAFWFCGGLLCSWMR